MKNFMNFVGIMLGAVMLCDKATDENYNFEAGMKNKKKKTVKLKHQQLLKQRNRSNKNNLNVNLVK